MKREFLQRHGSKINWIVLFSFVIILLSIRFYSFLAHTPKFKPETSKITVAEVYEVERVKGTTYADYVFKVNNKLYKSGTGGEGAGEFKNWNNHETKKYALIYNLDNPKLNFLLTDKILPDSFQIGTELRSDYFDYGNLKSRMLRQTVQSAYIKEKYLREYQKIKEKETSDNKEY